MSDWADDVANSMWSDLCGRGCEPGFDAVVFMASHLRAAEKRGRVAGLREAATECLAEGRSYENNLLGNYFRMIADKLEAETP